MRSPLYLDTRKAKRVRLDDAALQVMVRGTGPQWYPLRCLSRVVVTGRVHWDTPALLACLTEGIPVAFRRRDGRLIGHCLSDACSRVNLEQLLESMVQLPQGQGLYQQWLIRGWIQWREHGVLLLAENSETPEAETARQLESQVLTRLDHYLPCETALFQEQLRVLVAANLSGVLLGYGFSDNIHVPLTPLIHPYRDLSKLLEWDLLLRVAANPQCFKLDDQQGLRYSVVRFFQQHEARQEQLARSLLNQLWRHLKEDEID